ncbi:uncharacterized protein I303_101934 [Kwoniella dejecticola CBS 10117]|uniref:Uncharacterized protein n=1 Tax=Kwoniella dejecticola CBS 10117 TaxID=1296121 RepID=A0A1A6ACF4_9TREE|nr:uncharacterized protein I303_01930 [Kwoniella dejecticola CBS 10117]OBR87718.1 hypothetical protein I303_01930 [Kwoniella dejecticola CBS 10117]
MASNTEEFVDYDSNSETLGGSPVTVAQTERDDITLQDLDQSDEGEWIVVGEEPATRKGLGQVGSDENLVLLGRKEEKPTVLGGTDSKDEAEVRIRDSGVIHCRMFGATTTDRIKSCEWVRPRVMMKYTTLGSAVVRCPETKQPFAAPYRIQFVSANFGPANKEEYPELPTTYAAAFSQAIRSDHNELKAGEQCPTCKKRHLFDIDNTVSVDKSVRPVMSELPDIEYNLDSGNRVRSVW